MSSPKGVVCSLLAPGNDEQWRYFPTLRAEDARFKRAIAERNYCYHYVLRSTRRSINYLSLYVDISMLAKMPILILLK